MYIMQQTSTTISLFLSVYTGRVQTNEEDDLKAVENSSATKYYTPETLSNSNCPIALQVGVINKVDQSGASVQNSIQET